MSVWSYFASISASLISWSPATLAKMVGNLLKRANYVRIYLLVLTLLTITCLTLTPLHNLQPTRGWGILLLGVPVALGSPLVAAALDAYIVRRLNFNAARRPSVLPSPSFYDNGDGSTCPPACATRMNIARSVQDMRLWQLMVVSIGEEIGFRIGVPIITLRATPQWFALVLLGTVLFAYGHSVFGWGQVFSKLPFAILGTILFLIWGLWASLLGHLVYNIRYWWLRNHVRGSRRTTT